MRVTYREFEAADADYRLLAEIDSSDGDESKTVEELREEEKHWEPDQFHVREFILAGDKCIGADIQYKLGKEAADTHSFFFTLLPAYRGQGLDEDVLEHLIDRAKSRGAQTVTTNARDHDTARVRALEGLGFLFSTSLVESKLDLERFSPSSLAAKIRRVEELGIAIRSAAELDRVGIDWLRLHHEFMARYMAEEHPTEPQPAGAYEEYRARAMDPKTWFPPGQYAAFEGDTCIGITSLSRVDHQPDTAFTGLTNVATPNRRKGVATALKVASLHSARQAGIRFVRTINEGHIPMLQLNVQLGFQKVYAILCYKKTIEAT